jgi:hypothetical protein
MSQFKNFTFYRATPDLSEYRVVLISNAAATALDIFLAYDSALHFPYRGNNWNSLYDCLMDLGWIKEDVAIIHVTIPKLSVNELRVYIEVLDDVIESWNKERPTRVKIFFPEGSLDEFS